MSDIALPHGMACNRLGFVVIAEYKEFPFCLYMHCSWIYIKTPDMSSPLASPSRISVEETLTMGAFSIFIL